MKVMKCQELQPDFMNSIEFESGNVRDNYYHEE